MRGHDLRLVAPACAAWAAALATTGSLESGIPSWTVPAACWVLAVAVLAMLRAGLRAGRGRPAVGAAGVLAALLVAASAAALVASSAWIALEHRHPPAADAAAEARDVVRATVRLDAAPRAARAAPWSTEGRVRAAGTILALDVDDGARPLPGVPVRVDLSMPVDDRAPGFAATVVVEGRLAALPGSSRAAYRLDADRVLDVGPAPSLIAWTHPLRAGLAQASLELGGDGGALVPGLAIGDTSRVTDDLRSAMTTASLTHLTAVSGANCAIVTAAAFWAAGLAGLPRLVRVLAAVAALGGFAMLVTPEASVVRASAMAVVVLVACATARAAGGVPALAVAVVVLLAIDPWYSRDAGFALSACATAGLVLWAGPLATALGRRMPRPLAVVVAIPLAAQLACQPVLVLLEPVIPVYGVPANLLAAPAAPLATVAGLVGCLLLPVLPSVGVAALQVAWVPASWIALLARGVERLPVTGLPWPPDLPGALLAAGVVGGAMVPVLLPSSTGSRARRALRGIAVGLSCICTAVPLGAAAGPAAVAALDRPTGWDLWQCDVEQGDAVLVRSAAAVLLVDAGPDPAALGECLDAARVDRIDLLVLTHWDADHVGGTPALAGRVGTVLHGPPDGGRSERALDPLVAGGAEAIEVVAGRSGALGDARWRIVWPRDGAAPGNDASVVVDLHAPGYRAVFLGDLGRTAQDALRRSAGLGRVDVVKVAHHGSADQSPELYRELSAPVGLVGVGADNGYGHPTDTALELLRAAGTVPVRSDLAGSSAVGFDADGIALWTERASGVAGAP
ncbi:ComEC/Rec2 family competence protein [Agromyces tropicus]|uniref:ComEC/Rec2 family competence protein n=1 Tax=Agromyces tropicus TaxID=555371 RepID=A0ABN2TWL2_9MICO